MAAIIIDIECRDRFGEDKHFATVVESIKDIHGALMDCLSEIRTFGWVYLEHTFTIQEGEEEWN